MMFLCWLYKRESLINKHIKQINKGVRVFHNKSNSKKCSRSWSKIYEIISGFFIETLCKYVLLKFSNPLKSLTTLNHWLGYFISLIECRIIDKWRLGSIPAAVNRPLLNKKFSEFYEEKFWKKTPCTPWKMFWIAEILCILWEMSWIAEITLYSMRNVLN